MKTGVELIAEERKRQIEVEGYDLERDKQHYENGQLMGAAGCYLSNALSKAYSKSDVFQPFSRFEIRQSIESRFGFGLPQPTFTDAWPWDPQYDKRDKHDILRSLVISGALIAAQIDLLQSGDGV